MTEYTGRQRQQFLSIVLSSGVVSAPNIAIAEPHIGNVHELTCVRCFACADYAGDADQYVPPVKRGQLCLTFSRHRMETIDRALTFKCLLESVLSVADTQPDAGRWIPRSGFASGTNPYRAEPRLLRQPFGLLRAEDRTSPLTKRLGHQTTSCFIPRAKYK